MSAKEITKSLSIALFLSLGVSGFIATPPSQAAPKAISAELAPILEKGYNQMKDGNYNGAVKTLKGAVKVDSDSITARRYLAFALVRANQPLNSIKQLNLIIKQIQPTYFEWCTFGEAYLKAGGVTQAQNCYEQALKVAPTSSYARSGLIRSKVKSGSFDEALQIAEKGMKGTKDNNEYEYFKSLYMGVRAQQVARGGSSMPLPATGPTSVAKGGDTSTPPSIDNLAQKRANEAQSRKARSVLKRITSSPVSNISNHPGG